jgi:hypothetical protein
LGALGACEPQHHTAGFRDWEVVASVESDGVPQAGFDVKVWIVDVDKPGETRAPIEMEFVTTDAEGEATWTYGAVAEPYVCGYEVRNLSGGLIVRDEPFVTNHLGSQGRVLIELP